MITTVLKKSKDKLFNSPDKRGRHAPHNKLGEEKVDMIRKHILSFNPSITHYRRKHPPNRLYISPVYSCSKMVKDFNEKYNLEISKSRYYQEIKKMNISFVKLGEEECELCDVHEKHLADDHGLATEAERKVTNTDTKKTEYVTIDDCDACSDYVIHLNYAKESRAEYREDKERLNRYRGSKPEEMIVSADLQKVIMLPVMPGLKKAIFCKRIVMFNETFAPVGGAKNGKPIGM